MPAITETVRRAKFKDQFKDVPIGGKFKANLWGSGDTVTFVKRDKTTATELSVFKKYGHKPRSWHGRTSFYQRDPVKLVK